MDHIFTGANWPLISSRLRMRLVGFLSIAIALVGFTIYAVVIGEMDWRLAAGALIVSGALGYVYGRLIRVHWDDNEEEVVTRMDAIGFVIILVYLALSYSREWLLGHFFTGTALTDIALTIAGGILIGRFLGMHISLMNMIRAHRPTKS